MNIEQERKALPLMEGEQETQYFLQKLEHARKSMGHRDRPNVLWLDEHEDDTRIRFADRRLSDGIPSLAQSLTDWENGVAVLGGLPNSGKSSMLTNMEIHGLRHNPELMVVDLSFDDDLKKRYQQWVAALTGLRYQEITSRLPLTDAQIKAKKQADTWLESMVKQDRLRIYDGDYVVRDGEGRAVRRINLRSVENIIRLLHRVRRQYPERKIVFFVDAWNDLDIQGSRYNSENTESTLAVNELKEATHQTNCMVWLNCHLRKTQGRRASLEDLKGTSGLGYAAIFAAIFRNELRENSCTEPLVREDEHGRLWPVGIVDIVKNKVSGWDFPLFYILKADRCGLEPMDDEAYRESYMQWTGRTLD